MTDLPRYHSGSLGPIDFQTINEAFRRLDALRPVIEASALNPGGKAYQQPRATVVRAKKISGGDVPEGFNTEIPLFSWEEVFVRGAGSQENKIVEDTDSDYQEIRAGASFRYGPQTGANSLETGFGVSIDTTFEGGICIMIDYARTDQTRVHLLCPISSSGGTTILAEIVVAGDMVQSLDIDECGAEEEDPKGGGEGGGGGDPPMPRNPYREVGAAPPTLPPMRETYSDGPGVLQHRGDYAGPEGYYRGGEPPAEGGGEEGGGEGGGGEPPDKDEVVEVYVYTCKPITVLPGNEGGNPRLCRGEESIVVHDFSYNQPNEPEVDFATYEPYGLKAGNIIPVHAADIGGQIPFYYTGWLPRLRPTCVEEEPGVIPRRGGRR